MGADINALDADDAVSAPSLDKAMGVVSDALGELEGGEPEECTRMWRMVFVPSTPPPMDRPPLDPSWEARVAADIRRRRGEPEDPPDAAPGGRAWAASMRRQEMLGAMQRLLWFGDGEGEPGDSESEEYEPEDGVPCGHGGVPRGVPLRSVYG